MIRRIVSLIVALTAIATAAGVLIVAAAYALFALVRDYVGPAGAAGVVCLAAAILIGVVALLAFRKARPKTAPAVTAKPGIGDKIFDTVRERPVVAAAAAAAAGLLAWRNPQLVSMIVRLLDTRPSPKA